MGLAFLSSAAQFTRQWGECALDLAFPWPDSERAEPVRIERPFCEHCAAPFPELDAADTFTCSACESQVWHFDWARSAYRTEGQVLEAVVGFKYHDESYRLALLVKWLTEAFDQYAATEKWDGLVPVPLYHRRKRERGFNQAREMARGLSSKRKIPICDCLYRYRETPSQTGLRRKVRFENMKDAFERKPAFDVAGKNLLLIDDVFTTGATTNACAKALIEGGASRVAVLTVARS